MPAPYGLSPELLQLLQQSSMPPMGPQQGPYPPTTARYTGTTMFPGAFSGYKYPEDQYATAQGPGSVARIGGNEVGGGALWNNPEMRMHPGSIPANRAESDKFAQAESAKRMEQEMLRRAILAQIQRPPQ